MQFFVAYITVGFSFFNGFSWKMRTTAGGRVREGLREVLTCLVFELPQSVNGLNCDFDGEKQQPIIDDASQNTLNINQKLQASRKCCGAKSQKKIYAHKQVTIFFSICLLFLCAALQAIRPIKSVHLREPQDPEVASA